MSVHTNPDTRHDFVLLFDATDCNPNGNPDAENRPRIDHVTGNGLVTDVALKRKVRDAVAANIEHYGDPDGRYLMFMEKSAILNDRIEAAAVEAKATKSEKGIAKQTAQRNAVNQAMAAKFFDIRMFGAVLSTGATKKTGGQVTGPIQFGLSRSVDPITVQGMTVTRMAATKGNGDSDGPEADRTMGNRYITPYGLYVCRGSYAPHMRLGGSGSDSAMSTEDLELFWWALSGAMFDLNVSHSKSGLATRGLFVFSHDHPLGSAPRAALHESVSVSRREGVEHPRSFGDYEVEVGDAPAGVSLTTLV